MHSIIHSHIDEELRRYSGGFDMIFVITNVQIVSNRDPKKNLLFLTLSQPWCIPRDNIKNISPMQSYMLYYGMEHCKENSLSLSQHPFKNLGRRTSRSPREATKLCNARFIESLIRVTITFYGGKTNLTTTKKNKCFTLVNGMRRNVIIGMSQCLRL